MTSLSLSGDSNSASRACNRSPKTIKSYLEALRLFREYLERVGTPTQLDRITREHVES